MDQQMTEAAPVSSLLPSPIRDSDTNKQLVIHKWCFIVMSVLLLAGSQVAADEVRAKQLEGTYQETIRPLLRALCLECHQGESAEAEVDLSSYREIDQLRSDTKTWLRVRRMLDSRQMPPKDSPQPNDQQRLTLQKWVRDFLAAEARAQAGDPGPIILRRLNNEEYNYAVGDLTGLAGLNPTREFPVDGAAGEGFINSGAAQGMSPALVSKYLDAAKEVAAHMVLRPGGIRFSPSTSQRDRVDALMNQIRQFYQPYVASIDAGNQPSWVRFQQGSRFPFEDYLAAALREKSGLEDGTMTVAEVATKYELNPRYLERLYQELTRSGPKPSVVLGPIRARWQAATEADLEELAKEIADWQSLLFQFNPIGHIGRAGGPPGWLTEITPTVSQREFEVKLPAVTAGNSVRVHLVAYDAGDGPDGDIVLWKGARLVGDGPDIPLAAVAGISSRIKEIRREMLSKTIRYLAAAAERESGASRDAQPALAALAEKHGVDPAALSVWLDYLGVGISRPVRVSGHFERQITESANYDFVRGWGSPQTPIVVANASDQQVRIPGIAAPHSLMVHPSPTLFAAVGWQSPIAGSVQISGVVEDAHPECGNGEEWFLQHRTSRGVNTLARGEFAAGGKAALPDMRIRVGKGDLVSLVIGPRAGDHACDLTRINMILAETAGEKRKWDMAADLSRDIHLGNPLADRYGNKHTWHMYKGLMTALDTTQRQVASIPAGSLLAQWKAEKDAGRKQVLAESIQKLVLGALPKESESPDSQLYRQVHGLEVSLGEIAELSDVILDERFGKHPLGGKAEPHDLLVSAADVTTVTIPAQLAEGRTVVVRGQLDPEHGAEGSVRLHVGVGEWTGATAATTSPLVVLPNSKASMRLARSFGEFRELFPPALCYARIVPVDQVVTLTLFFREDDHLQRLMLDADERARLDRIWDELFYLSQEPLKYEVAFEQIREFATQDRPDLVKQWAPLVEGVKARAERFRQRLTNDEPVHLAALLELASRAWRRPLSDGEYAGFRQLYTSLRENGLEHEAAMELLLARLLTSPAFLYRLESPPDGTQAAPVSDLELASRLSFFLWSSVPDQELREVAAAGKLTTSGELPAADQELLDQVRRMLIDPRIRRLAVQFACQWLHLRDFDKNDDKNEQLYPQFSQLRVDMYEETVRFFTDMFQHDGSILDILDADHTYLNQRLARHYGIPWPAEDRESSPEWKRVSGVKAHGRGGLLGMGSFLASQSGASRTSPILRGNWVYETLLGQRLPRPPANVPQLPDTVPSGLTARQLIEKHSSTAECAICHARIDPFGFALSGFDAIGRARDGQVNVETVLDDGTRLIGLDGLRDYLRTQRRDEVVGQFCRKLLGFSLGREVQLSDEPLLETMREQLSENDYRFSVAIAIIVTSPQFQRIRGREASD